MTKQLNDIEARLPTADFEAGRRAFFKYAGLASAGAAVLGVTGLPSTAKAQEIDDPTILNFALNLEYLEAEFYLHAAFGRGLPNEMTLGTGDRGAVSGGRRVDFDSRVVRNYAREIANDEEAHVGFLRSALGGAAVARPAINIDSAFTAAARAAGVIGPNETFDAYANENNFLLAAFIFEDVGVTAYKGAARFISDPDVLEAAAGLLAVEAYHAGEVRSVLYARGLTAPVARISNARDSLDGAGERDQGIGVGSRANIVPADDNALAFSRTPQEVLNIVYLGGEANDFGFFPDRMNGNVR